MKSSIKMKKQTLMSIILCMIICSIGKADYPKEIEISCKDNQIMVGVPVVFKLTYKYEKPQISNDNHEIWPSMSYDVSFQITKDDEEVLGKQFIRGDLYLQDIKGIKYSGNIIVFYDLFGKKLVFDAPGKYTIIIRATNIIMTKMDIQVQSVSQSDDLKAVSLLTDPNDFRGLIYGFGGYYLKEKRTEVMLHLKKVVEQCEKTVLAKWCAARLGLEYFSEFHEKHPSFEKFRDKYKKKQIKEPLLEQAQKYLTIGSKLPDEFPIREKVLKELLVAEFTKGNDEKVNSIIDELGTKYPKGEHGKRASEIRKELLEIQKREKQKAQ